jgi:hypothetical protein
MTEATHAQFEALIHSHFTRGGLSPDAQASLRDHVRGCPGCERAWERYAAAERGLYGGKDAPLTLGAQARVEAGLIGPPAPPPRPWTSAVFTGVAATLALGVALTVVAPLERPGPGQAPDDLRPRGGAAPTTGLGLRVLRLREVGGELAVTDLGAPGDASVQPGDNLALLYVNLAGAEAVEVRLEPEVGPARVLRPRQPAAAGEDQALGAPQAVARDWPTGKAAVVGRFFGPDGALWTRTVWVTVGTTP